MFYCHWHIFFCLSGLWKLYQLKPQPDHFSWGTARWCHVVESFPARCSLVHQICLFVSSLSRVSGWLNALGLCLDSCLSFCKSIQSQSFLPNASLLLALVNFRVVSALTSCLNWSLKTSIFVFFYTYTVYNVWNIFFEMFSIVHIYNAFVILIILSFLWLMYM